jgi:methionine synthase I (cobalamin-dependent)
MGLPSGMAPELWNTANPETIEAVARSYVEAGSEIILTNTFGANRYVLERSNAADRVEELAIEGVRISHRAAKEKTKVFASIGPTGKMVLMGELSPQDFRRAFTETTRAIVLAEPDAIVLETFNELAELRIALKAVKASCKLPVVACMSFTAGPENMATMMGNTPEELVEMVEQYGADAVGANCGVGPESYLRVARRIRVRTELPIWIKPNAGAPETDEEGNTVFPIGPAEFAAYGPRFVDAGVRFMGGCCGTTPEHIRAMKNAIERGNV